MDDLGKRAFKGLAFFQLALAAMLLLPAWSLTWWQGWVCWMLYLVCGIAATAYFLRHAPGLVRRRLHAGPRAERNASQKRIQLAATVFVVAVFIVGALDYRFGWSAVPTALVIAADVAIVIAYLAICLVFRENEFAAATINVETEQRVITTGPYALVRHPMYVAAALLFVATAIALGSWWALIPTTLLNATLVWRLLDEEIYLARNLPGYADYMRKVTARLVPGVW